MTTQEIKSEIQKSLDHVPENVLLSILEILKQAEHPVSESKILDRVSNIIQEDRSLLEKLAK